MKKLILSLVLASVLLSTNVAFAKTDKTRNNIANIEKSEMLIEEGKALLEKTNYSEAKSKFNEAVKINPENAAAYAELGFLEFVAANYKNAIPYYKKAVKFAPNNVNYYAFLCTSELRNDDTMGQGLKDLNKGIELYPNNVGFLMIRQRLYSDYGNHKGAINDLNSILKLSNGTPEIIGLDEFYGIRAGEKIHSMDYDGAIEDFKLAIKYTSDKKNVERLEQQIKNIKEIKDIIGK